MDPVSRLQLRIFQDEMHECWQNFQTRMGNIFCRHNHRISPTAGEIIQESEGRIWVQVGLDNHKIRVTHLHPANPAVAKNLKQRRESDKDQKPEDDLFGLHANVSTYPETDDISLSSLEDYWFNHWQGPPIAQDNNKNLARMRRSVRRSRRKSRCSICHKKVAEYDKEEDNPPVYTEPPEKDILAHMPSLKPETIVSLDEIEEKSDDEISRFSTNEDALSRSSINDDPAVPAIVNRVIDNETRTSCSLFAEGGMESLCMDSNDTLPIHETVRILSPPGPTADTKRQLGQSRSCPCTPKLPRGHSPAQSNGISTFSLSNSLIAIHKQASSSLRSDFLKFDLRKSDSTPDSRRPYTGDGFDPDDSKFDTPNTSNEDCCKAVMSVSYKAGQMISEEREPEATSDVTPDAVPEVSEGVVNLGFDGHGESSDFSDSVLTKNRTLELDLSHTHAVSIGHISKGVEYALSVEPETGVFSQGKEMDKKDVEVLNARRAKVNKESQGKSSEETPAGARKLSPRYDINDLMEKCRESIYWWRSGDKHTLSGSQYCLNELECLAEQKPLLFFIHGVGTSSEIWTQQMWYFLSCGYEVVAPDLFGHGLSSAPDDAKYYTFSRMLDCISLAFDLFVPPGRKCVVIGHNYGASLAVAFARGRPFCVALTVLISCGGPSPLVPFRKEVSTFQCKIARILHPFIMWGCLSRQLLQLVKGKHHYPAIGCVPSAPAYVLKHMAKGQVWPEGDVSFHRRITVPTLLLYGMRDRNVTIVEMCDMEKTIPRAFLELITSAGHDVPTDASAHVSRSIHRFIKRWKTTLSD